MVWLDLKQLLQGHAALQPPAEDNRCMHNRGTLVEGTGKGVLV
jgi:hypothetical protein